MDACTVFAEVLIEGAATPVAPWYLCYYSLGHPGVCTASFTYNAFLQSDAFRELNKKAAEIGCTVAVQAAENVHRIAIVQGAKAAGEVERAVRSAKRTHRALNTPSGLEWLMHQLGPR